MIVRRVGLSQMDNGAADMMTSVKKWFVFSLISSTVISTAAFAQSGKEDLDSFKTALDAFKAAQYDTAIPAFENIAKRKTDLEEYARYYLAQAYLKTNKNEDAEKEIEKLQTLSPNVKMSIEASNLQGQVALAKKSYKQASALFTKLEKRTRNTESYPEIIYNLALAQKGLNKHALTCKWLQKLYEKYPAYSKVQDWSVDLAANEFDGIVAKEMRPPSDFDAQHVSVVISSADKRIDVLLNGEIAVQGPATIEGGAPLGSTVFILSKVDGDAKTLAWHAVAYGDQGAKLVSDPDALIRRIHADDNVLAFMRSHMTPGLVMVTTDLPMTPDTRTGKDFVVMNSGEA